MAEVAFQRDPVRIAAGQQVGRPIQVSSRGVWADWLVCVGGVGGLARLAAQRAAGIFPRVSFSAFWETASWRPVEPGISEANVTPAFRVPARPFLRAHIFQVSRASLSLRVSFVLVLASPPCGSACPVFPYFFSSRDGGSPCGQPRPTPSDEG